jgi:hypothetical protein
VAVQAVRRKGEHFTVQISSGVLTPWIVTMATAMVVRRPVHMVPRDMFGRPKLHTNVLLSHLPLALRDTIAVASVGMVVGDLSRGASCARRSGPTG